MDGASNTPAAQLATYILVLHHHHAVTATVALEDRYLLVIEALGTGGSDGVSSVLPIRHRTNQGEVTVAAASVARPVCLRGIRQGIGSVERRLV